MEWINPGSFRGEEILYDITTSLIRRLNRRNKEQTGSTPSGIGLKFLKSHIPKKFSIVLNRQQEEFRVYCHLGKPDLSFQIFS